MREQRERGERERERKQILMDREKTRKYSQMKKKKINKKQEKNEEEKLFFVFRDIYKE